MFQHWSHSVIEVSRQTNDRWTHTPNLPDPYIYESMTFISPVSIQNPANVGIGNTHTAECLQGAEGRSPIIPRGIKFDFMEGEDIAITLSANRFLRQKRTRDLRKVQDGKGRPGSQVVSDNTSGYE